MILLRAIDHNTIDFDAVRFPTAAVELRAGDYVSINPNELCTDYFVTPGQLDEMCLGIVLEDASLGNPVRVLASNRPNDVTLWTVIGAVE